MPWYIRRATTLPCHTYHLRRLPSAPTPPTPCHATRRQATPCHVTPCHVTSSCLPLQPIDCWSTWPRRRHQVNVRTQLVRSTSLAYSLTISRTRHRRRRSGYITSLTIHHGRGLPSTDLAHHPLTLSLAVMYYVLRPRSRSMYTGHPRHRDPLSPRSLPIMQVAQNSALRRSPFLVAAASHHHVVASGIIATTTTNATISTRHQLHLRHLHHRRHHRHHPRPAAAAAAIVHCHHHRQIKSTHMQHGSER